MAGLDNKCCIPVVGIGCIQRYIEVDAEADTEVGDCNILWVGRNVDSGDGCCVFCGVCNDGAHAHNHVCRNDVRHNGGCCVYGDLCRL